MRSLLRWLALALASGAPTAIAGNRPRDVLHGNQSVVVLTALDVVPDGVVPCTRGCSEVRVLFGISVCFSDVEINAVLDELDRSVVTSSTVVYFNNGVMPRSFEYGAYLDGSCSAKNRRLPTVVFDNLKPQDKLTQGNYDLYVNIAKNKGGSFTASLAKTKFKVAATREVRVCSGAACPSTASAASTDLVVGSIDRLCDLSDEITTAMYCSEVIGARPWTYRSDQRKLQCGCVCSGGKIPINGVCGCPGDLMADAGCVCGCTSGRVATSDNRCVCPGGRVLVNDACVCPSGTHVEAGVCVPDCYWNGGLTGSVCSWQSAKSALRLVEDCALSAPVPKSSTVFGSPSSGVSVTVTAAKRGASSSQSKAGTWLSCSQKPGDLENQIAVSSFGVHDLSMVLASSDNRLSSKCLGCVAVVDAFPPTAIKSCTTVDDRATPSTYSTSELANAIAAETAFAGFYSPTNVQNNGVETADGDNNRCDESSALVTDVLETAPKPLASLDAPCFTATYLADLVGSVKRSGVAVVAKSVQSGAATSLVCERCCYKAITLKERFRKYSCGASDWEWGTQGACSCQYGRCLRVQARDLVAASSVVSDLAKATTQTVVNALPPGTTVDGGVAVIHRSIPCTKFDQGCRLEAKLGELLNRSVNWNAKVPADFKADDVVYWQYKSSGVAAWKPWNDNDVLAFQDPLTLVSVQAWTRCGVVHEATYKVKLHPHAPHDACNNFGQRFLDNSPSPHKLDGSICAFPGSDFVLLTFKYDSLDNVSCEADSVRGSYTDVKCFIALAEHGAVTTSKEVPLPLEWNRLESNGRIRITKPFALELVSYASTSKNTDGKIRCEFTYKYAADTEQSDTESCAFPFQLTDCEPPSVDGPFGASQACLSDQCASPLGLPGAFEACSGDVFTAVRTGTATTTTKKPLTDACCTACDHTLSCVSLAASPAGVKRCEPALALSGFVVLAKEAVATLVHGVEDHAPSTLTSVVLLSAGAMAVAVVVSSTRSRRLPAQESVHEVYIPLLD